MDCVSIDDKRQGFPYATGCEGMEKKEKEGTYPLRWPFADAIRGGEGKERSSNIFVMEIRLFINDHYLPNDRIT